VGSDTLRLAGGLAFAAMLAAAPPDVERIGSVSIFRIEGVREFAEATAPGAIRRACADDRAELEAFFAKRKVKWVPGLVRPWNSKAYCHIFFEPSAPLFRASSDDEPITRVFGALDPAGFVGGRKAFGDSLEILKLVLGKASRPLRVTLTINRDYDPREWPKALERHFGGLPHSFETRPSRASGTQPWAQDYIKSGWSAGEQTLLAPYRIYEGRAHDGDAFRPLLDSLEEGRLIRSKLSWEGGDLQFARDPRDPRKVILFHGSSAGAYWGKNLDPDEYAYVLRSEFGADASIDFSGLSAHTDYIVLLLPERTVLLSEPVRGDIALARAAAQALIDAWGDRAPPILSKLSGALARPLSADSEAEIRGLLVSARRHFAIAENEIDPDLARDLDVYTEAHCPGTDDCFEGAGRQEMLDRNPALLARALDGIADVVVRSELTPRLLGLIEGQLRAEPWPREALLNDKAREIEALGFRVLRIPQLVGEKIGTWPGVSYANSLVLDKQVFVPAFGLGSYEQELFRKLAAQLGPTYEVIPTPARYALLRNGGVHCVFGLVRGRRE
jgi:hypothetical protein